MFLHFQRQKSRHEELKERARLLLEQAKRDNKRPMTSSQSDYHVTSGASRTCDAPGKGAVGTEVATADGVTTSFSDERLKDVCHVNTPIVPVRV